MKQNFYKNISMYIALIFLFFIPFSAFAAPWDNAATSILNALMSIARIAAIIAVVVCGLMALAGKLAWPRALQVIAGIVIIFGATYIVDLFSSSSF